VRDHELTIKQLNDEHQVNINLETHQYNVTYKTLENKIENTSRSIEDVDRQLNHYDIENMSLKNDLE